ncbi:MAG TPA: OmpA family protein, partial [Chitinophagales bacterium]|nr:OmpA family protein [Chitinophagales bacterium]HNC64591.1 OmpA family protein [Chitinophagales bacterium]HNE87501.1 OmpA family protein [Chitinophagales bacterium]HNG09423.1 OmpA family protein [Chitinophagales bacterium]HNJ11705.1 OmpA family protein [Chitinophagales bacterium]
MRKRILLLMAICMMITSTIFAEMKAPRKATSAVGNSKWSLGLGMEVADFYSPKMGKLKTFKTPVAFGPRIGFWRNFNASIALGIDVASYAFSSKNTDPTLPAVNTYNLLYAGSAVYKFNNGYVIKEDAGVAPYIFAKIQGAWAEKAITKESVNGLGIPIGAGINFKIANNVALNTYGGYNFAVKNNEDHIFFGAGLMVDLGKGKTVEEPVKKEEPVKLVDTDGDGIADIDDACPEVAGIAQFNGCPDTDGDGIPDKDDECPEVAGVIEHNGCPDTDGDGIPDSKDACPTVKGVAEFGGCPNPDSDGDGIIDSFDKCPNEAGPLSTAGCPDKDGDGIADKDDKCPNEAGPASTKGCPEAKVIQEANTGFKDIQFDLGKATIRPESYSILDNAAKIMIEQLPNAKFEIGGHTDSKGSAALNNKLSQSRADAVVKYLISKGVDKSRLTAKGYGSTKP